MWMNLWIRLGVWYSRIEHGLQFALYFWLDKVGNKKGPSLIWILRFSILSLPYSLIWHCTTLKIHWSLLEGFLLWLLPFYTGHLDAGLVFIYPRVIVFDALGLGKVLERWFSPRVAHWQLTDHIRSMDGLLVLLVPIEVLN